MMPYSRQNISEEDITAITDVLKSDYLTQGPKTPEFEKIVSKYCGVKYGCAVNSATSGLHIACLALGVGKGDIVWTSPISFVASSNCALYCGASVDFVDIDSLSYNMSISSLEEKLILAKKKGSLPKVVIPVHLSGKSCDMEKIHDLSKKYGFKIIEDASHAIGSTYKNQKVGSCSYSDITVFSFHPVKIITTCEGGMCMTNDPILYNLLLRFRSHGISRQAKEMKGIPDGSWYYEQLNLGYNYRLNDLQSVLGISQLKKLDSFVNERNLLVSNYNKLFDNTQIKLPKIESENYSSWHLYIIRVNNSKDVNRNSIFEKLRRSGIYVNIHYIPIYRHPFYKAMGYNNKDYPEAEKYYEEAISIPLFPGLTLEQQENIKKIISSPIGHQNLF